MYNNNMPRKNASFPEDLVEEFGDVFGDEVEEFNSFANNKLRLLTQKEKYLKKNLAHIEFIAVSPKGLIVKDHHLDGKVCEISLRDKRYWCSECKPMACGHIFYALAKLESGLLIDLDGQEQSK